MIKVEQKLIQKGESNGNFCIDMAVQRGAVQHSLVHYIAVQCSKIQSSTVQWRVDESLTQDFSPSFVSPSQGPGLCWRYQLWKLVKV